MTPQDDLFFARLERIAQQKRSLVSGIPNQAVSAMREEFEQALRDAEGESPRQNDHGHGEEGTASPESIPRQAPVAPLDPLVLPESYGPDGDTTQPVEPPRLELEG